MLKDFEEKRRATKIDRNLLFFTIISRFLLSPQIISLLNAGGAQKNSYLSGALIRICATCTWNVGTNRDLSFVIMSYAFIKTYGRTN